MQTRNRLASLLLWSASLILVASLATWLTTGAHRGWTRTQVTVMSHDEVTGIDYPEQRPGFVAGLDLLGAGIGLSLVLGTPALFLGRRQQTGSAA